MTHYWWMHWFWITLVLEVYTFPHSNLSEVVTKSTSENTYPPSLISNGTLEKSKPKVVKKLEKIKLNTSHVNKEAVIQNVNFEELAVAENQTNSFLNHTDNFTYIDKLNQTSALSSERADLNEESNLSAAGITGITLGCVIVVGVISAASYFLYRSRGLNRPQVLSDRCSNPDSSGYIDDASVRDNSEEMYSLDNDSFLNSLEAMTIQNYWIDTVKHTKL